MGISWINKGSQINLGFYCRKAMLIETGDKMLSRSEILERNTLHVRENREYKMVVH